MSCPGKYIKSFHFHLSSLIHKHFTYRFLPLGTWLCSSYVSFGKGNQTKRQRFCAYVTLLLPWAWTIFWWLEYGIFYPMFLLKKLFCDSFIARKLITLWNWMFMNFAQMNWSRNSKLLDRYLSPFAVQFCVSIIIGAVLNWILYLLVKMLRDAENAKFGLKTEAKASSSKENEVIVSCYLGTLNHQ